ncbi:MAG TPA: hypothetical protein VG944_13680 [Fimbriimonas sp.]|nr:hypothetical protein [Fimbriimonas sp.]
MAVVDAVVSEDGKGIVGRIPLGSIVFARINNPPKYLGVYEVPYDRSPFKRTLLLGRDEPEATHLVFPAGVPLDRVRSFRTMNTNGRIGARIIAAYTASEWLAQSQFPSNLPRTGPYKKSEDFYSVIHPDSPGRPSKGLFSTEQQRQAWPPGSTICAIRFLGGLNHFVALVYTGGRQIDRHEVISFNAFDVNAGRVHRLTQAESNPFFRMTSGRYLSGLSWEGTRQLQVDPLTGAVVQYDRGMQGLTLLTPSGTSTKLHHPAGFSNVQNVCFSKGRLLATFAPVFGIGSQVSKAHLFEWQGNTWLDLGAYRLLAHSCTGNIILVEPSGTTPSSQCWMIWPKGSPASYDSLNASS